MGIIFKEFKTDTYCENCNTEFLKQFDAFSEIIERPLQCSKCGGLLSLAYDEGFYVLRGTNIKIPFESPYAKIFIRIPAFVVMSIPVILIMFWLIDVISYALGDAIKRALLIPMWLRLYGTEWPAIFPGLLIVYFIFQVAGLIYNNRKLVEYSKTLKKIADESKKGN